MDYLDNYRFLRSLKIEELQAICCYFDIDYNVYVKKKKIDYNKAIIITCIQLFNEDIIEKHIQIKLVCFEQFTLFENSLVLFGQFGKQYIDCCKIMKQIKIPFNEKTFEIVYGNWIRNTPITYIDLKQIYLNYKYHRYNSKNTYRIWNCFINNL